MMSSTVWHGHSTRPSLPAGTARKASGHLSERGSSILLTQDRSVAQKPHWGFHCSAALRKRELALAGRAGSSHPQQRETERSRRGTPCCTYRCRRWIFQGASGWAHPIFVSSWLGVRQNVFTVFSPWLHRGWFCAVPPSGRTIPPLQGRREQRRHWFWYPVRRSFPCPQRTA